MVSMRFTLRLLMVEEAEEDAVLVLRELESGGFDVAARRVASSREMRDFLRRHDWDLIVSDYALTGFDAREALKVVESTGRDIPFIVVSGQIGEDRAVEVMKAGAHDYVLKSNLARLVPVVVRELKEAKIRQDRRLAQSALKDSEARYRAIVETNTDMICRFLRDGRLTFVNSAYCRYFGKRRDELVGRDFSLLVPDGERGIIEGMMRDLREGKHPFTHEHRVLNAQGEVRWNHWTNSAILDERGRLLEFQAVGRDITERKNAENELRRLTGELLRMQDEERRRLALELHDTTAQKISALSLNLNYVLAHGESLTDKASAALRDALGLADSCMQEVRTLSYLLHPPELDLLGLRGAINDFVKGFSRRSGIAVEFEVIPDFERLPVEVETALFRIVQESLTNVHRHSGSETVWIRLWRRGGNVHLQIMDEGQGFSVRSDVSAPAEGEFVSLGVGMAGMRERLKGLNGRLEIQSNRSGTTIQASVPA